MSVLIRADKRSSLTPVATNAVPFDPVGLGEFIPPEIGRLKNPQTDLPRIAREPRLMAAIEEQLRRIPTVHDLYVADARDMRFLRPGSVHLVVTSPPYWTLKEYRASEGQMGHIADYERFLGDLKRVWQQCFDFPERRN